MAKKSAESNTTDRKKTTPEKKAIETKEKAATSKLAAKSAESPKKIEFQELVQNIFEAYGSSGTDDQKKQANDILKRYLRQITSSFPVLKNYNLLIIHDGSTMVKDDADQIYNAITAFTEKKPILLILYSNGGDAGSAYLISRKAE